MITAFYFAPVANSSKPSDFEFIDSGRAQALESAFLKAELTPQKASLLRQKWVCDMYGMRSRLQIKRHVALYEFENEAELWKNSGEQVITTYKIEGNALVGKSEKIRDQIRVTPEGQLISRVTLASEPDKLIAYSRCTATKSGRLDSFSTTTSN